MYYSDLVAVAEKDITSRNFLCLVDVAVMLYEEEKEKSDKRIFHLFPRKPRSSSVEKFDTTRKNPQQNYQNLNGASTCSSRNPLQWPSSSPSLLGDYKITAEPEMTEMIIYPRNPLQWHSSSSLLLDLNTIPADDSETKDPQNPNDLASSPSSSSFLGDYKTEMRNPRNPNSQSSLSSCLTEKKCRKRRALQECKRTAGKSKKAKLDDTYSWIGRETPDSLIHLMLDTNETVTKWGERTDLKLIFQRKLFKTDVNPGESRLSMPFNELIQKDFLTPVELRIIREDINNVNKTGVGAILVDERNVKYGVMLKRWEMKKDSGKGSWNYALTCGWNDVVKANGLKLGDNISIWCFRWGGLLCFSLVTPPPSSPSMAQSSSSLALGL